MNKYPPENDRYWPVGRAGVAGLTPVSTYRGSSPHPADDVSDPTRARIEDLVSQGVTRERAEFLVEAYGTDPSD